MRDFARIQEQVLSLDIFDPIESFPECGGIDILWVLFVIIMKVKLLKH